MSSSKGSSNSNKTAHVMNLLRKSNPPAQSHSVSAEVPPASTDPVASADSVPAPAPAPAPQVHPIITSLNADAEVSSQIRDALADALESELEASNTSAPQPELVPYPQPEMPAVPSEEAPSPESAPAMDVSDSPAAPLSVNDETADEVSSPAEGPSPEAAKTETAPSFDLSTPAMSAPNPEETDLSAKSPVPAPPEVEDTAHTDTAEEAPQGAAEPPVPVPAVPQPEAPGADDSLPAGVEFINVTERLARDKMDKYIQLFGLCSCPRCKHDVLALALNHLTPKYVVMNPADFQILSDMYSSRYSSEITAQLLWACKTVMDNPRH